VGGGGRNLNQGGTLSEFIAFATKNWLTPCFHAVNTDISHCSHGRAIIPIVPPFRLLLWALPFSIVIVNCLLGTSADGGHLERSEVQALLSEIREARRDLQAAALAARRAHIVSYRLHEQEMAVERATKRWENAKSAVAQTQMQRKYNGDQRKRFEEHKDRIENEQQRKQYSDEMSSNRDREEALQAQEQELQSSQFELEQQLKIAQANSSSCRISWTVWIKTWRIPPYKQAAGDRSRASCCRRNPSWLT